MSPSTHQATGIPDLPALHAPGAWDTVFQGAAREALEATLPRFVMPRRWFGAKARTIRAIQIIEALPILPTAFLTLMRVEYAEGDAEMYALPVAFATGAPAQALRQEHPAAVIAALQAGTASGILYDAVLDTNFCQALLAAISQGRQIQGASGDMVASTTRALPGLRGDESHPLPPHVLGVEQSNTSIRYADRLILKLYRRLEGGVNPDQEIGQFLTEKATFANIPPLAGALEFRRREPAGGEPITLALLQGFVPNHGDAWRYSLHALADYFETARAQDEVSVDDLALPSAALLELVRGEMPAQAEHLIGVYLASARLLGRRTAELHLALTSDPLDPVFAPEPFTREFQATLHRSMQGLTGRILDLLRARLQTLPEVCQPEAREVLALEGRLSACFERLLTQPIRALRSRIHGDYHLGQVLYTGDDFMIIDFEGEPARPLSERQMKRSPLQDVAGMLRSFHYAAYAALFAQAQYGAPPALESWARFWFLWVSVAYLKTYLEVVGDAEFLPSAPDELELLLDAYLVEKAVYELGYELNNRPDWVRIPLAGILHTVEAGP